jgi:hypothetical protein
MALGIGYSSERSERNGSICSTSGNPRQDQVKPQHQARFMSAHPWLSGSSHIERPQDAQGIAWSRNFASEKWTVRLRCKPISCTFLGIFLSRPFRAR